MTIYQLFPEEAASLASYESDERRVSIFSDSQSGADRARQVAVQTGVRVLFNGTVGEGISRLIDFPAGDVVLVDIARDSGAALDVFLDRLDAIGWSDRTPVIVNCAHEVLDRVDARMSAPSVALMSDASTADWISTLAMFGTARDPVLRDAAVDDSMRLQRLADEVQRIARTLADLVGNEPLALSGVSDALIGFRAEPAGQKEAPSDVSAADVRMIIRMRRMRDRFFRSDFFADPAWDMLLDLMGARLENIQVAVSSLCIASAVPPTTALRWIKTMSDSGIFVRVADPNDGRRVFIALSDEAASAMSAYLSAAKATGGLAI